ncbi:MAG: hypothetical protein FRX49_02773 [Trebouxia sp. A1-2]|nr:MAG: hypothetical protein FRX49_02773 [Trebouxia sp. A1-2]
MVSITPSSRDVQKSISSWLSSSLPLCAKPLVHAKMLATGFVDVGLPFWYSLQWRVTVPAAILHDEAHSREPAYHFLSRAYSKEALAKPLMDSSVLYMPIPTPGPSNCCTSHFCTSPPPSGVKTSSSLPGSFTTRRGVSRVYAYVSKYRGNIRIEDQLHADLAVRRRRRPCRYRTYWSELREMP